MARDPKQDPYYNPDFSPEVNEVTNDFTYKKFNEKQITGDAVIIKMNDGIDKRMRTKDFDVLLIQRKRGPHQNGYALPGGIYEEGMDSIEDFIGREALEEVGLQTTDIVNSYDLPPKLNRFDWDARAGKGVDVYGKVFVVDSNFIPNAADDALSAKFVNIKDIANKNIDLAFGHAEWILDSYRGVDNLQGQGFDDTNKMKMYDIVDENTKRNQEFIVEVNKKRVSDNFDAIDLSQDTNIKNTFDAEFETNFPPDQFEGEGPIETTPFDEHMAGTTDAEIAEWYGEKYGKDYITDTKTMTAAQINDINTEFKTDVAKSFVDDTDEVALSAREWLNENTSRGVDPTAQMDDTLAGLEQSNADMFPDNLENALTDDEIFMRDVQPQIDDYYADMAAREPNIDNVNSYYESLNQADQELIDAHYENMIDDAQTIKVNDVPVTGKVIKQTIKNRLKKLAIGGIDALDMYELSLIGMALVEPAVQKALNPIMPMIVPGFKGKLDSKTYGQQVIENLQTTAKISPTAKVAEKFAAIPEQGEYNSYSWVGKMLDR